MIRALCLAMLLVGPATAQGVFIPAPMPAAPAIAPTPAASGLANDYPTEVRADYVFACMSVNGQNSDVLKRCSCSIDVIAEILPYQRYVDAETVLRVRQVGGDKSAIFNSDPQMREMVAELRRAQAEGEVRCF